MPPFVGIPPMGANLSAKKPSYRAGVPAWGASDFDPPTPGVD